MSAFKMRRATSHHFTVEVDHFGTRRSLISLQSQAAQNGLTPPDTVRRRAGPELLSEAFFDVQIDFARRSWLTDINRCNG